jgi:hypothetical protein
VYIYIISISLGSSVRAMGHVYRRIAAPALQVLGDLHVFFISPRLFHFILRIWNLTIGINYFFKCDIPPLFKVIM